MRSRRAGRNWPIDHPPGAKTVRPNELLNDELGSGKIRFEVDDLVQLERLGVPPSRDGCLYPRPAQPDAPGILYFARPAEQREG